MSIYIYMEARMQLSAMITLTDLAGDDAGRTTHPQHAANQMLRVAVDADPGAVDKHLGGAVRVSEC